MSVKDSHSALDVESTSQSTPRPTCPALPPRLISFLKKTALANVVYDLLFDDLIDVDSVKEMLNLFALVATLFIGGVYGLIGSVTYDELRRVDEMWTNKTYAVGYIAPGSYSDGNFYADLWYSGTQYWKSADSGFPSAHFNLNIYLALSFLVKSMLCILFLYLSLLFNDYKTNSQRYNAISFAKNWNYVKYAMIIIAATMVSGIVFSFFAFYDLAKIKIPNSCPFIPEHHQSDNWLCTEQFNRRNTALIMILTLIPTFLLIRCGCIAAYAYKRVSVNEECQNESNVQIYQILRDVVITDARDAFDSQYERKQLRDYHLSIADNCIDYRTFLDISDEELLQLGVKAMGHRKMILAKTKELKGASTSWLS